MSIWSDTPQAFRDLPPEEQAFWRNLYDVYTRFGDPNIGPPAYDGAPKSPIVLFYMSRTVNDWLGLPLNQPYWVPGEIEWSIYPDSPQGSTIFIGFPIFNFWTATEWKGEVGTRAKYRVRKSYWTGTPRQRRNL